MTAKADFYQDHLDRVSRSFAFCIRQLPEPLHDWIGLSYLLCRVVDTIEDSSWPNLESQLAAFRIFDDSLTSRTGLLPPTEWVQSFPADVTMNEQKLVADASRLLADFQALPPQVHEIICELVLSMSQGMQHFCRQRGGGVLCLSTLGEVNQYCFFVAGVVGELLAKLVARVEPRFRLSQGNVLRAHHFGLFLQKVNLLKDQIGDEKVGRHLIPSREKVENSSSVNAEFALDFLLDLPKEQIEFRRFCAWSLFLGLEALRVARDSLLRQKVLKVPRSEMEALLLRVEEALGDDSALRALFSSCAERLGWPKATPSNGRKIEFPDWILLLYRGPLSSESLVALGVTAT